jgi:hypothetical protein
MAPATCRQVRQGLVARKVAGQGGGRCGKRRGADDPAGPTDEAGCFTIDPVPGGPFRLRCRAAGSIDVLSGWITL